MRRTLFSIITAVIVTSCLMAPGQIFAQEDVKINLNTATKEQLIDIGLDAALADKIIEYREQNGEFVDMAELQEIDGVDSRTLRQLERLVFIEPAAGCAC